MTSIDYKKLAQTAKRHAKMLPPVNAGGPTALDLAAAQVALEIELERDRAAGVGVESWRNGIASFAQHLSRGAWQPYRHCVHAATVIERELAKGAARVIVNMPPRYGKSQLFSYWLPAWLLDRNPDTRVLACSYSADLAVDWAWKVRNLAEECAELNFAVAHGKGDKAYWGTADRSGKTRTGGIKAAGVNGSITGFGGNVLILDDPVKNWAEAHSPAFDGAFDGWWGSTFFSRLEPGGSIVIVMTRWTDHDPTAKLIKSMPGKWTVIRLPELAEDHDPLGRAIGEALCPERYPLTEVLEKKETVGPYVWAGMHQQRPAPIGGNIVKRDQFQYYTEQPALSQFEKTSQYWDFNVKETVRGSYVCGQVWGRRGAEYWLLDQVRGRWGYPEAREAVRSLSSKWPAVIQKMVEAKANGPAVMADLQSTIDGFMPFEPYGDKVQRFIGVSPLITAHNVFIPDPTIARWVHDYVDETTTFPNSTNNDQVDTTSMALADLRDFNFKILIGRPDRDN